MTESVVATNNIGAGNVAKYDPLIAIVRRNEPKKLRVILKKNKKIKKRK